MTMYKVRKNLTEELNAIENLVFSISKFLMFILLVITLFTALSFNRITVLVEGRSMAPTLASGDFLVVNTNSEIERGDIIVIKKDYLVIKRVIGLPGETVSIKEGYVYVNNQKLDEPYIIKEGVTENANGGNRDYIVGEGEYFFLGDNRIGGASKDSRSEYGNCTLDEIVGVVEGWSLSLRPINNFLFSLSR